MVRRFLNDIANRGVKDVLIASVDGLTGFPEAINAVFPQTDIQLCIVHMVRNSLKYVGYKDRKQVAASLKQIYQSVTEEEALLALDEFEHRWGGQFPSIAKSWRRHWDNVATLFIYPEAIRRAIYTTNAIESLNSVIRKSIRNRKIFIMMIQPLRLSFWLLKQLVKNGVCRYEIGHKQ